MYFTLDSDKLVRSYLYTEHDLKLEELQKLYTNSFYTLVQANFNA